MKLQAKNNNLFFKFETVGDKVHGVIVSFDRDVPGKFGDETNLVVETDDGRKIVRCPKGLAAILGDNEDQIIAGATITITFTGTIPTGKASPMKTFDVDVIPGDGHKADPDDAPF